MLGGVITRMRFILWIYLRFKESYCGKGFDKSDESLRMISVHQVSKKKATAFIKTALNGTPHNKKHCYFL